MESSKNLILAIALSILVLIVWQIYYVNPLKERMAKVAQETAAKQKDAPDISKLQIDKNITSEVLIDRKDAIAKQKRIRISTDNLHGSLNLTGGRIDDLTLAGYHQTLAKDSPEVVLLSPASAKDVYFAEFGWITITKGLDVPNNDTVWQADKDILHVADPVTLTWTNNQGIIFTRVLNLDDKYMFTITQTVKNNSTQAITILPYGLLNRARENGEKIFISHEGPLGVFHKVLNEVTYDDMHDQAEREFKNTTGWLGIADKYWLTAMIPAQNESFDAHFKYYVKNEQNRYQVDFLGSAKNIAPGESINITQHLFTGAKKVKMLDNYGDVLNIPLFDRAVDFGWLYFLTRPIFGALKTFYGFLGNFGLAVMLLTVIIKIFLFPLANASYKSMAKMRKVQPEMLELKERYKNDKLKLNQEIMKFYKERDIRPAAGCLPVLIQIPIFFSLYKVLFVTIEMRHAPFYGWIKDLSAPDPTNIFNLFGLLSWTPPAFIPAIGVLPILFAISMFIQQKLNPPPQDPTQAIMMKWLPVVFLFLFAGFPAGLVIYWVWSNILSILQQWVITRRMAS